MASQKSQSNRTVTLRDVAQAAGVSISTASKVLNGKAQDGRITPECSARVVAASQELGYRPNLAGRSLRTGRADAIGFVVDLSSENADHELFWSRIHNGLVAGAFLRGYHVVMIGSRHKSQLDEAIDAVNNVRVDGLIVTLHQATPDNLKQLEQVKQPVVLLGYPERQTLPSVEIDDRIAARQAAEHLLQLGHRRIAWVAPQHDDNIYMVRRRAAFTDRLKEAGVTCRGIHVAVTAQDAALDYRLNQTRAAIVSQWPAADAPTALACYDESIAAGAYAALRERELSIPNDVSVIGFDDVFARMFHPALTVGDLKTEQLGHDSANLLIRIIQDPDGIEAYHEHRQLIQSELVIRHSTATATKSSESD